jgi:methionine-rich copper-binding protein CopC
MKFPRNLALGLCLLAAAASAARAHAFLKHANPVPGSTVAERKPPNPNRCRAMLTN